MIMYAEYISYESLVAARDAANWAFWSMLSGWTSLVIALITLVFSGITLYFANRALDTWRVQEKTKAKIDFKKSLLGIRNTLGYMPDKWSQVNLKIGERLENAPNHLKVHNLDKLDLPSQHERFIKANDYASDCWVLCEHLFDGTLIEDKWNSISAMKKEYLDGRIEKNILITALNELYSERFVFESK